MSDETLDPNLILLFLRLYTLREKREKKRNGNKLCEPYAVYDTSAHDVYLERWPFHQFQKLTMTIPMRSGCPSVTQLFFLVLSGSVRLIFADRLNPPQ